MTWLRKHGLNLLVLCLLACVFAAHCAHYWPYLSDDALISLRYAERFADGLGLTWTDGERVEGYSDLLWVLLTSAGSLLGFDSIWTARIIGIIGGITGVIALGYSSRAGRLSLPRQLSGSLLLALSSPLAVWSIGGLEHGFMMGVLAVGLVLSTRCFSAWGEPTKALLAAGLPFAALALLRADGAVLLASLIPGSLISRCPWRQWPRRIVLLCTPATVAVLAQLTFRRWYYEEWVPNSALVKISLTEARFERGIEHVTEGIYSLALLITLALVASIVSLIAGKRQTIGIPVCILIGWVCYVGGVGGDIFPAWRQLSLAIVPLAWLVAECAELLMPKTRPGAVATAAGLMVIGLAHHRLQLVDKENQRGVSERWPLKGEGMGTLLRKAFGKQKPLLAVDAAGGLPYWSRLPSLDMLGLNDRYLPRHPPPRFGGRGIGHDLGDGDYVWMRSPDILAFNNSVGSKRPIFYSGIHMMRRAGFHRKYQLVRFRGLPPTRPFGVMYLKRSEGPLGIQLGESEIHIPAYYFASDGRRSVAELGARGQLEVKLLPQSAAVLPQVLVPRGTWKVVTDPPEAGARVGFHCGKRSAIRREPRPQATIELRRQTLLSVLISRPRSEKGRVALRKFKLVRAPSEPANFACPPFSGPIPLGPRALSAKGYENDDWMQPEHFVFSRDPLHIDLGTVHHSRHAEVSVDNNDVYDLHFLLAGSQVHSERVNPVKNGGGMAVHKLELPGSVSESGFDTIHVVASGGDRRFSLGHLKLSP